MSGFRLFTICDPHQYGCFGRFCIGLMKPLGLCLAIIFIQDLKLQAQDARSLDNYIRQIVKPQDEKIIQSNTSEYFLLELNERVKKTDLLKEEIEILRTISPHHLIVKAKPPLLDQHHIRRWESVNHLWKVDDHLLSMNKNDLHFFFVKTTLSEPVIKKLTPMPGIKLVKTFNNVLIFHTSLNHILDDVIVLDEVTYAGIESKYPKVESRVLDLYLSPNTINQVHHSFPEHNGKDLTLSIRERRYNPEDIDLQGRDIPSSLAASEVSMHATDMATIAAGAGNSFINGRGVAWLANITSSDFSDLFPDPDASYTSLGVRVQNHAYGTVIENTYGTLAEAFDQNANRLPDLLHVFSAGNQGAAAADHGMYKDVRGFANITGNFKMAKNILTVGSVDTIGHANGFSSRGPAYDGRIKPELVAFSMQGTSNSAALVSGLSILMQQRYQLQEGVAPSSALIKALLINSARDAGPPGIDFITGFGSVDAYRTLLNLRRKNFFTGALAQGEIRTFNLDIPAQSKDLKVTIVWNDPATQPNFSVALINDLDMRIDNGSTWLPWVVDHSPDSIKLSQPAIRNVDHLNNIEQITIADPPPGQYTISIEGYDIAQGPQEFYVAYQLDTLDQFRWTFPTGSDNFPYDGETATYFFWNSTLSASTGRLEYSIDNGSTWITIADAVDLKKGNYRWANVPDLTTVAQARFVVGNDYYLTEKFTISRPLAVSVGFDCADSVMLQWPMKVGASGYEVYTLKDKLAEPILITTDTSVILNKIAFPSKNYTVQPVLDQGQRSLRSPMLDYTLQGTECFLISFFEELNPEDGIYLNIQLGTIYGIDQVVIEHATTDVFEPLMSWIPRATNLRFLHQQPPQGLNRYRVRIKFRNGQEIVSETVENYFLTSIPFVVFPNPVPGAEDLKVFSKIFQRQQVVLRLYKSDGSLVLSTDLYSDREFISLNGLPPGLYVYRITSEEGIFNGRVVLK